MTNEEKAKKIVLSKPFNDASSQDYAYKCAMEMAEWKDEQHNKNVKTWQLEFEKKQILIGELYEQIGKLVEELHKKN